MPSICLSWKAIARYWRERSKKYIHILQSVGWIGPVGWLKPKSISQIQTPLRESDLLILHTTFYITFSIAEFDNLWVNGSFLIVIDIQKNMEQALFMANFTLHTFKRMQAMSIPNNSLILNTVLSPAERHTFATSISHCSHFITRWKSDDSPLIANHIDNLAPAIRHSSRRWRAEARSRKLIHEQNKTRLCLRFVIISTLCFDIYCTLYNSNRTFQTADSFADVLIISYLIK